MRLGLVVRRVMLLLSLVAFTSLTACNTVKGVGQDVQAGGRALERVAS